MASGGTTSTGSWRRCGRSISSELSADNGTTGFGRGRLRIGEHPKCKCRTLALICRSRTADNPNRLFFGCPYFKEKQGYCEFFAWFDEIFEYVMDDVVEGQRLASVDTGAGNKGVVSLNNDLDERVKQLEDFLWKKDEDNQFVKKHNVFYFLRGVIVGALIGVVEFCIFVVAV
ncbi:hypothetical protein HN51_045187 [Arachis hypogaea]|uniref:GRF-type domain-containing protein n=1 Tax=Arachis hypogaea TaxID=3818 RepID=A0A444XZQ2_ARAHY|nr:hypothetical protein Ahy_B08g090217 [Arachis hypogaea]